jgi:hypothetical protein
MIELRFRGWFQARLATDPDPYDEPRGVSGYVHAYAGEPDLDRVIHFQPPAFSRSPGRPVRVAVDEVIDNGVTAAGHPLLGATVDLLDQPKFEGRNGLIADDGFEPIYPFRFAVDQGDFRAVRAVVPSDPTFPYSDLFAGGVEIGVDDIRDATGESGLIATWNTRLTALEQELSNAPEPHRTGIGERIDFLRRNLATPAGGAARFFLALMRYDYRLTSPPKITDPDGWISSHVASDVPWTVTFWLGAWDADALCGYARGTLRLPDTAGPDRTLSSRPARITDRRP